MDDLMQGQEVHDVVIKPVEAGGAVAPVVDVLLKERVVHFLSSEAHPPEEVFGNKTTIFYLAEAGASDDDNDQDWRRRERTTSSS